MSLHIDSPLHSRNTLHYSDSPWFGRRLSLLPALSITSALAQPFFVCGMLSARQLRGAVSVVASNLGAVTSVFIIAMSPVAG